MPAALDDPVRLRALRHTGLIASPDPALDRFAMMVRKILNVPVVLVSLVTEDRQFFPGASGLAQPWMGQRQTPLSHSFCQRVILSAAPLVITDAREDPRLCDSPAIADLSVIAYAGMPLTDEDGQVLGSLCAIDSEPREWSADDLDVLADLAAACSSELRFRIAARRGELAVQQTRDARAAQSSAEAVAQSRNQLLLAASEALLKANTVEDVVTAVAELVRSELRPAHVGVMVLDPLRRQLDLVTNRPLPPGTATRWVTMSAGSDEPAARAVRERRPVFLTDRVAAVTAFPHLAEDLEQFGWHALVCAPLIGTDHVLGTLRFAWAESHPADVGERAVILTLAGYVTQALERALHLRERITAAETLQRALLTALPRPAGYELAARYQPAQRTARVGGDWYDAIDLADGRLALVIGDVAGHDMAAAAQMGQLRAMLRAYLVDRDEPPADTIRRLDAANYALGDHTIATLVVAILDPAGDDGHLLQWSSAGHPGPIMLRADGTSEYSSGRGLLLGARPRFVRDVRTAVLPLGATLLFYTDGLVETRTAGLEAGIERLQEFLVDRAAWPLEELVESVRADFPSTQHEDDIAILGVRVLPTELSGRRRADRA